MPSDGSSRPLHADANRPKVKTQILNGATAGCVVLFLQLGIVARQCRRNSEPAGNGAPTLAFGAARRRSFFLGDQPAVQVDDC